MARTIKYFVEGPELKKQFRELSMKLHPDKPGGNAAQFVEMKSEYEYLKKNGFPKLPPAKTLNGKIRTVSDFIATDEGIEFFSKGAFVVDMLFGSGNQQRANKHAEQVKEFLKNRKK